MNTKEMIEVMKAFEDGKKIEVSERCRNRWSQTTDPAWNWGLMEYRIAPELEPKKEGRWERVEIEIKDGWYRTERDIEGVNVVDALPRVPGFGGIDYQSPFDPKVVVRSMGPMMFEETGGWATFDFAEHYRPGIPVAAWFWREE